MLSNVVRYNGVFVIARFVLAGSHCIVFNRRTVARKPFSIKQNVLDLNRGFGSGVNGPYCQVSGKF